MAQHGHSHHPHSHGRGPEHAHEHAHHRGHGGIGPDDAELAAMLDLDAEVLAAPLAELMTWLATATQAAGADVRRIVDLGAGTGAGTFALLERYPEATVTAVDKSPHMLAHLRGKADARRVADRVRTVEADLDAPWPDLGDRAADLVWASASLHHVADPRDTLHRIRGVLRPGGGLLALVELDGLPYVLPADVGLGRPGVEERCRDLLAARAAHDVPHLGSDWASVLADAGYAVENERLFTLEAKAPLPEAAGRYAQLLLRRVRAAVDGIADADDLAVLDTLTADDGPHGVLHRGDLEIRARRDVWVARPA